LEGKTVKHKPIVYMDVHDVLADYMSGMYQRYGWPSKWEVGIRDMWPRVDFEQHFKPSAHAVFLLGLKPIDLSQYGCWLVYKSETYRLVYLTAVKKGGIEEVVTSKWLRGHGYPPARLETTGPDEKVDYIINNAMYRDIVIDDRREFLEAAYNKTNAVTIRYKTPWNKGAPAHQSVSCWKDLIALFEQDKWEGRGDEL
jgi:hypothetical protein